MKKSLIIKLLIIFLLTISKAEARIINITPEFRGKIIDITTGKPIEKAIITVIWKEYKTAFDNPNRPFDGLTIITDKEGKYIIPRHRSLHLITEFTSMIIDVSHPLYARESEYGGWAIFTWDNDRKTESYEGTRLPNGTIRYDIKLVGIEEAKGVRVTGGWTAEWFKELKENYGVRYDLNSIWNKWVEILKKDGKDINYLMEIDNDFRKLKEGMDKLLEEGY